MSRSSLSTVRARAVTSLWVLLLVLVAGCGVDTEQRPGEAANSDPASTAEEVEPSTPASSAPAEPKKERRQDRFPSEGSKPRGDQARAGTAAAALAALQVKGRAPMTGYDRDRFGPAWLDADRNGCDTRNDMLAAYLKPINVEPNGCVVTSGVYRDRYTGQRIDFVQGHGSLVDIDHVVALGNGWVTGAFRWQIAKRAAFANDPLNLLPADAGANRAKGDGDAATWLPPNKGFRCKYVARQIAVKAKYQLWVTPPEKTAMRRILTTCPGHPLPDDAAGAPVRVDHAISDPGAPQSQAPNPAPEPAQPPGSGGNCAPGYDPCVPPYPPDVNCAEVNGPVRVSGPDPHGLDRDGDGVACE